MIRFGLALGGGGARGAAHVGVLIELEKIGLVPDLITGSSAGAIVGAMTACGKSTEEMAEFLSNIKFGQLLAFPQRNALINNKNAIKILENLLGRVAFEQLKLPLALVAVDLIRRTEVVLSHGDLVSAVLASSAFPGLMPPVERDGLTLIDGGLLNNVPFDVSRARGATHTLAVDLSNAAPYGTPLPKPASTRQAGFVGKAFDTAQRRPLGQILSSVTDILTAQSLNTRLAVSRPELLLQPDVGTIGLFDFHRHDEAIEIGREAIQPMLPRLKDWAKLQKARHNHQ